MRYSEEEEEKREGESKGCESTAYGSIILLVVTGIVQWSGITRGW